MESLKTKTMKLSTEQKFNLALETVEREFDCKVNLTPQNDLEKQTRQAFIRVCARICGIMPYEIARLCRNIDRYSLINKRIVSLVSNKAYHLSYTDALFRKKLTACSDEVGQIIQDHNKNGVKSIAMKSWGIISDVPQMKRIDLFSMGMDGNL